MACVPPKDYNGNHNSNNYNSRSNNNNNVNTNDNNNNNNITNYNSNDNNNNYYNYNCCNYDDMQVVFITSKMGSFAGNTAGGMVGRLPQNSFGLFLGLYHRFSHTRPCSLDQRGLWLLRGYIAGTV
jgi:hypothetical protein